MPFTARKKNNQHGFTLLELLISVVIISVIISIMFSAMRLGIRAWEKGEQDIEITHRLRIVKAQMKRQMASISTENVLKSENSRDPVPFVLRGDDQSIGFISQYSIIPGIKTGLVYAEYYLKDTSGIVSLMVLERDVSVMKLEDLVQVTNQVEKPREFVLLEDFHDLEVSYLKAVKDSPSEWVGTWNTDETGKEFPLAVKITGRVQGIEVEIIARLMSAEREPQ